MTKLESLLEDFQKAIFHLEEILKMEKSEVVRDAAIQRFEIAFDLCWKTAKAFLQERHNSTCVSPRSCFKEAFRQGVINHDDFWIEITSLRNYTAHTYKEKLAEQVYQSLPKSLSYFKTILQNMKDQYNQ